MLRSSLITNGFAVIACCAVFGCAVLSGCQTAGWNARKVANAVDDTWNDTLGTEDDLDDAWDQFDPNEPGGPEWWAEQAQLPIGQRQKIKKGKMWPPQPRPIGPSAQWSHRYHAAKYWPYPYVCQDRAVVNQFVDAHIENGWERQTTLFDYHFDPETHDLTRTGEQHLMWIMVHVPEQHRRVHVQKSFDPAQNEVRLESVRNRVLVMSENHISVPVSLRLDTPTGRPAEEVDAIRRAEMSVIAVPHVLPTNTATTGAGAAGGALPAASAPPATP